MWEDDLVDKLGVRLTFSYPSPLLHYVMPQNISLVNLFAGVQGTFTVLHQSAGFQGDFFSELPSFAFLVIRAGALHKDNFIPVHYGEGHMHL